MVKIDLRRICLMICFAAIMLAAWPSNVCSTGPSAMLAERYHEGIDPGAYWVSEKLDGVRALWDGKQLRFRSGQAVAAPDWFLAGLPQQALDGELWIGRRRFEELVGVVRMQVPDDTGWRRVSYMIFDLPDHPGSFTDRLAAMEGVVGDADLPWLQVVRQQRVLDRKALRDLFDHVVAGGGEGLMLHRADAQRTAGRSDALLKYVPWLDDEACVVAHVPGKGKYLGMLGALEVEAADGRRFRIGTGFSDLQRRQPPAIGTTITYRYRELTRKGQPRFPSFLRERVLP